MPPQDSAPSDPLSPSFLEENYYVEHARTTFREERNRTIQSILMVSLLLLILELRGLALIDPVSIRGLLFSLPLPFVVGASALLAYSRPLGGAILCAVLAVLILAWQALAGGSVSLLNMLFIKPILVFFIIKGILHARDAHKARESLRMLLPHQK